MLKKHNISAQKVLELHNDPEAEEMTNMNAATGTHTQPIFMMTMLHMIELNAASHAPMICTVCWVDPSRYSGAEPTKPIPAVPKKPRNLNFSGVASIHGATIVNAHRNMVQETM